MRIRTLIELRTGTTIVGKWHDITDEDDMEELKDIIRMVLKISPNDGAYFSVETPSGMTFAPRENIAYITIQEDDNES